jgi:protease II
VKALNLSTKEVTDVDFGMNVGTVLPGANEGYNIHEAVMFVNTPFHYNIGYKYNMATKELRVIHTPKLTGEKFDESKFRAHIVHAESETGDLIPITIVESI